MSTNNSKLADFPIPRELSLLIRELSEIYTPENHGAIAQVLTELIARLKQTEPVPNLAANLISSSLINEESSSDDDVKSWEDLLNFTVYVDTEIYSPNELEEAIAEPESVNVITHQEATDTYVRTWDEVATKLHDVPFNLSMRFWTTAEAAKIIGCSEEKLRRAKKNKLLPIDIHNFIVDCPDLTPKDQKQKKLSWLIRLKSAQKS